MAFEAFGKPLQITLIISDTIFDPEVGMIGDVSQSGINLLVQVGIDIHHPEFLLRTNIKIR